MFTPEQEAYLAKLADAGIARELIDTKTVELDQRRAAIQQKHSSTKDAQDEISKDPEVQRLEAEIKGLETA